VALSSIGNARTHARARTHTRTGGRSVYVAVPFCFLSPLQLSGSFLCISFIFLCDPSFDGERFSRNRTSQATEPVKQQNQSEAREDCFLKGNDTKKHLDNDQLGAKI